jgi:hypothetical protein
MNFIFKNVFMMQVMQYLRYKLNLHEKKPYPCVTCLLSDEDNQLDSSLNSTNHGLIKWQTLHRRKF